MDAKLDLPRTTPDFARQTLDFIHTRFPQAEVIRDLADKSIFTVKIDRSRELDALVKKAINLQDLPYDEKLPAIEQLAIDALATNAVEKAAEGDEVAKKLVYSTHPLSEALRAKMGCCRYQGVLFFELARQSHLGIAHFLLTQRMGDRLYIVYNILFNKEGQRHLVSIYNKTLTPDNKSQFGYPEPNQAQPRDFAQGYDYYAYFALEEKDPVMIKTTLLTAQEKIKWGRYENF